MENQKHTQGEWRIDPLNESSVIDNSGDYMSQLICQINGNQTREIRKANAKLIAAAPYLLGALEYVKICSNYKEAKIYGENNPNHWTNIIDNAINKATK